VSSILSLKILMRIPVGVEDDDSVGSLEIEAETSGASRQQEDEVFRVWTIKNPKLKKEKQLC
jgi:hypothetical protein